MQSSNKYSFAVAEHKGAETCQPGKYVELPGPSGYISSQSLHATGSWMCPWRLEAEPGQRINITLFDFQPDDDQNTKYG